MSALLQRAGELTELAEDNATVPFGVRDVLAVLLVGALGCQRESGEAAVVVGANFCVVAEEADEGDFVLSTWCVSVLLNFPILLGSLISEVGPAPKCQGVLSWRGPEEVCAAHLPRAYKLVLGGTETLKGWQSQSRTTPSRRAPVWPRSSDRAKGGIRRRQTPTGPKSLSRFSAAEVRPNRCEPCLARAPGKDGLSPLPLRSSRLRDGALKAFQRQVGLCRRNGSMRVHR